VRPKRKPRERLPLEAIRAVVATVEPVVATVVVRAETVPELLLPAALLPQLMDRAIREEVIDAPITRDARITKRERARLKVKRTKGESPARSPIRTHGYTSITTLRDPSSTTRLR
jgi:hypothetical protein